MLDEDRPDDPRRVYYERTNSPSWKILESAAELFEAVDPVNRPADDIVIGRGGRLPGPDGSSVSS